MKFLCFGENDGCYKFREKKDGMLMKTKIG